MNKNNQANSDDKNLILKAHIEHYVGLREEIQHRSISQRYFIIFALGAVGAISSLGIQKSKLEIIIAIPLILPFILARWREDDISIRLLGYYITHHITAPIQKLLNDYFIFGWDQWKRVSEDAKLPGKKFMAIWLCLLFGITPTISSLACLILTIIRLSEKCEIYWFVILFLAEFGTIMAVWSWLQLYELKKYEKNLKSKNKQLIEEYFIKQRKSANVFPEWIRKEILKKKG